MKFFVKLGLDSIRPTPARPFGLLIVGAAAILIAAAGMTLGWTPFRAKAIVPEAR